MRQTNAAKWFQCKPCPWKRMLAMTAKTMSDTHSWITLSCTRLKGPPLSMNPIRLAGTWQQYSKKAMAQLNAMTPMSGQWLLTPVCCSFRCPYHASVMKMLLSKRSRIVYIPFILIMYKWVQRYVFSLKNVWKRRKMIENKKKWLKNLVVSEKSSTFATAFEKYLNC